MDHAGALAHAADRYRFPRNFKRKSQLLVLRIRRHDRLRRKISGLKGMLFPFGQKINTCTDLVGVDLHSDNAGRSDKNAFRIYGKRAAGGLCLSPADPHSLFSGAGIRDAGIDDDGLHCFIALTDDLPVP